MPLAYMLPIYDLLALAPQCRLQNFTLTESLNGYCIVSTLIREVYPLN